MGNKIKLRIGVDIDDVLLDLIRALSEYHNTLYGTTLTKEDFHTFYFNEVWGGTLEEAISKVHDFVDSSFFYKMQPILFSQESINFLKRNNYLINITSRLECSEKKTFEQINYFYGDAFREIYFTNEWTNNGRKTKEEICSELQLDVFIDDSLDNIKKCSYNGTKCFLFGDYSWNKCHDKVLPEGVVRVKDWREVMNKIENLV